MSSLESLVTRTQFTGDGIVSVFQTNFWIQREADVVVIQITDDATPVYSTLVLDTDYTVTLDATDYSFGSAINLIDGSGDPEALVSNYTLLLYRAPALLQKLDMTSSSSIFPESITFGLDFAMGIAQWLQDQIDRTVRIDPDINEAGMLNTTLLDASERALKFLAFDASGDPIASSALDGAGIVVTTYMETLLDDTTASAALTTLGLSAFVKTLVDDASAGDFMTTLGFSAFFQTLVDDATAGDALTTLGFSAYVQTLLAAANAKAIKLLLDIDEGLHTIWIPASEMVGPTTNPANLTAVETATNKIMLSIAEFSPSTQEFAQFAIAFPKGWDEGTITYRAHWYATAGTPADTVDWALEAIAVSDDDVVDAAWGTEIVVTDTMIATGDMHVSAISGDLTVGGTPAEGDLVYFRIKRNVATDNLAADAKLFGITLLFTRDVNTDD